MSVQNSPVVVVGEPVAEIGPPGRGLARLVLGVGLEMRAVRVARIEGQRLFHERLGRGDLAGLAKRQGVHGHHPPVVAVMRQQGLGVGEKLRLAPDLAGKADQAEDVGAKLRRHGVAGMVAHMGPDRLPRRGGLAGEQEREGGDVVAFPLVRGLRQFLGPRDLGLCVRNPAFHHQRPRQRGMTEREIRIGGDRSLECLGGAVVGAEKQLHPTVVVIPRLLGRRGERVSVSVADAHIRHPVCRLPTTT
jgi:hypothetical protein